MFIASTLPSAATIAEPLGLVLLLVRRRGIEP